MIPFMSRIGKLRERAQVSSCEGLVEVRMGSKYLMDGVMKMGTRKRWLLHNIVSVINVTNGKWCVCVCVCVCVPPLATLEAQGSSRARDQTWTTAVTMPDP